MYKKVFSIIIVAALALGFYSCEKDYETDKVSSVTYFPEFTMTGDPVMYVNQGSAFTDPGVSAIENGSPIDVESSTSGTYFDANGNLDGATADKYVISYSAVNSDGFPAFTERTVWVFKNGDLVSSIEGLYTATVKRGTVLTGQYTNMKYVLIVSAGNNKYVISDALGGYYDIGRAYGAAYAAQGTEITATDIPGNVFSATQATIPGFGNLVDVSDIVVDAAAKTITFKGVGNFANATFYVNLKQVQP